MLHKIQPTNFIGAIEEVFKLPSYKELKSIILQVEGDIQISLRHLYEIDASAEQGDNVMAVREQLVIGVKIFTSISIDAYDVKELIPLYLSPDGYYGLNTDDLDPKFKNWTEFYKKNYILNIVT